MKKIVLLGDSIRMGYDKYVKEAFEDVAEVYYPKENCRFSQYFLRFLKGWKKDWPEDIDLVHWNAGLWDLLEIYDDGPLTPIEFYEYNIARIDRQLRKMFPKAKFVFATSTGVDESGNTLGHVRLNSNIEAYNAAALRALAGTDTVINDLYALTKDATPEWRSDRTHYSTPKGLTEIGGRVIETICQELEIQSKEVDLLKFLPEKYSKENIGV